LNSTVESILFIYRTPLSILQPGYLLQTRGFPNLARCIRLAHKNKSLLKQARTTCYIQLQSSYKG